MTNKYKAGFTLTELIIALAIVSILAAVAIPSYNSYVLKGYRNQAIIFALDLAKKQEEYFNMNGRYGWIGNFENAGLGVDLSSGDMLFDDRYQFYNNNISENTFRYRLFARNGQRSDTDCLLIIVDETTLFSQASGDTDALCS